MESVSAQQAYDQAGPGEHVIGWKLDRNERDALLSQLAPRYPQTVADHVTLRAGVAEDCALPREKGGLIVGRSDDGRGVEALVVSIGGTTRRPDGSTYHITWSLADSREAIESNQVIAACGWEPIEPPLPVTLWPQRFP